MRQCHHLGKIERKLSSPDVLHRVVESSSFASDDVEHVLQVPSWQVELLLKYSGLLECHRHRRSILRALARGDSNAVHSPRDVLGNVKYFDVLRRVHPQQLFHFVKHVRDNLLGYRHVFERRRCRGLNEARLARRRVCAFRIGQRNFLVHDVISLDAIKIVKVRPVLLLAIPQRLGQCCHLIDSDVEEDWRDFERNLVAIQRRLTVRWRQHCVNVFRNWKVNDKRLSRSGNLRKWKRFVAAVTNESEVDRRQVFNSDVHVRPVIPLGAVKLVGGKNLVSPRCGWE